MTAHLPWAIQNALDNRITLGPDAPGQYWDRFMNQRQHNRADLWIMRHRKDILHRCQTGGQRWRFCQLIEVLYAEHEAEEARAAQKEARKEGAGSG